MDALEKSSKLSISLLLLRLGIAAVMIPWAIDKIMRPEHAAAVFRAFYMVPSLSTTAASVLGILQLIVIAGFLGGFARTWTYGAILAMHTVATLTSWNQYLHPFEGSNLLFFAAWPMLAACVGLFLLRDQDRLFAFAANPAATKTPPTATAPDGSSG